MNPGLEGFNNLSIYFLIIMKTRQNENFLDPEQLGSFSETGNRQLEFQNGVWGCSVSVMSSENFKFVKT